MTILRVRATWFDVMDLLLVEPWLVALVMTLAAAWWIRRKG